MRPDQLAGLRIERDHGTPGAARGVDDAIDHERRAFQFVLRERAEVVGLEAPRNLELIEVRPFNLVERPVPASPYVSRIGCPLGVLLVPNAPLAGRRTGSPGLSRRRRSHPNETGDYCQY